MQRTKLETAAADYSYLRGLFGIPLGVLVILAALVNWGVGPLWAFLVAVAVAGAACLPIAGYYNENYGRLSPSTRQQARGTVAAVIGVLVVGGGSLLLHGRPGWSLDLPVNGTAVVFALFMLIFYAIVVGLRVHHVIIWGALLVAGALPVWNAADPGNISNIGLVLAGVAVMVSGVFDHRMFVHTFGPPRALDREDSDVGA
jgi:hypothetical protein